MLDLFNDQARRLIGLAHEEALDLGHEEIATEHLLLAALNRRVGPGAAALASLGVTQERAHTEIVRTIGRGAAAPGRRGRAGRPKAPRFSTRARWILERARREAATVDHKEVGSEHILLALLREDGGGAARILDRLRTNRDEACRRVLVALDVLPYPGPTLLDSLSGSLDARIEQLRAAKDEALDHRDFGQAVDLRHAERTLLAERAKAQGAASKTA